MDKEQLKALSDDRSEGFDTDHSDRTEYWIGRVGLALLFLFLFIAKVLY